MKIFKQKCFLPKCKKVYNKYSFIFNYIKLNKLILFSEDAKGVIDAFLVRCLYGPLPKKFTTGVMKDSNEPP